jgi:anti-sigma B factor antagonist
MIDYYDSEIELFGDVAVLAVAGETDLHSSPRFRGDLSEAMDAGPGDVILDLSDLELIDSTALGIMMAAAGRMMQERRALVLVVNRRHVLRVFGITGLGTFFSIVPTRAEALAKVSSPHGLRQVA